MAPNFDVSDSSSTANYPQQKIFPSGYSHSFDTQVAKQISVNAAIVYNHFIYWLRHNKLKDLNQVEGRTWTFESIQKMADFFEYLTEKQVRTAIQQLVDAGIIIEGWHHKNKFNRTTWYALQDETVIGGSKKFYEAPVRADVTSALEGGCIIKEEHKKQETQQQQSAAVFDCLKDLQMPESEKTWLSEHYQEADLIKAVAWATSPTTKITKTLEQALKWWLKSPNKPVVGLHLEEVKQKHCQDAHDIEQKIFSKTAVFVAGSSQCEIHPASSTGEATVFFEYGANNFHQEVRKVLDKYHFGSKP